MAETRSPLALFTAGAPGAGKSEVVAQLLRRYDLASLDCDAITVALAARRPQRPFWASRPLAMRLLDRWQDALVTVRAPLLVNTTAADLGFVLDLRGRLAEQGYRTAMIFVEAHPADCLSRNAARTQPRPASVVEHKIRACAANRAPLGQSFQDFLSIANYMELSDFVQAVRGNIWPWLDQLGAPRRSR